MSLSPETLPRHELIGLPVRVADAPDRGLIGIAGEVVMETTRTLSIEGPGEGPAGSDRVWQVPKVDATFEFTLPADEARRASERPNGAGTAPGETVTVAGERLESRPARRTERTGDSKWR